MGILLASLASLCEEVFSSIGKYEQMRGRESAFAMAFLSLLGSGIFFVILLLAGQSEYRFVIASLPTFLVRVCLEAVQVYVSVKAVMMANRSTFSFVRTGTMPLLLAVDMILGYVLHPLQLLGVVIIMTTLFLLLGQQTLEKKGIGFVLASMLNAVVTTSLYKYNITHYNSVIGEQLTLILILLVVFFGASLLYAKQNPLRLLRYPVFLAQSGVEGIAGVLISFAFVFAPASLIIAAHRSSAMIWSIVSGGIYFGEQRLVQKVLGACLLAVGTFLLAF